MIDREKYLERQRRYNRSEKGRERGRRYNHTSHGSFVRSTWASDKRINDPVWAVTQDIKRTASRHLRHRSELLRVAA